MLANKHILFYIYINFCTTPIVQVVIGALEILDDDDDDGDVTRYRTNNVRILLLLLTMKITSCGRTGGHHDMPRPGLQVVTRYTSCTHMDKSPLLYVHVDLPVRPTKAAW